MKETIQIETTDDIAVMTINRPPANAIDLDTAEELENTLAALEKRDDIGALIVTGAGKCFSAGLDLKAVPTYNREQQEAMVMAVNRMFGELYGLWFPTIAAINGHAIAGGVILALACDYRIAAEGDYKIGLAEARVGVAFPVAAMTIVKSELAPAIARTMVLTARNYNSREALAIGVVSEVQSVDQLLPRAFEVGREMAALPRLAYRQIKNSLRSEALALIDNAISNRSEPMLGSWLSEETRIASAEALKKRQ